MVYSNLIDERGDTTNYGEDNFMGDDLLDCPFCGKQADIGRVVYTNDGKSNVFYKPHCIYCGIHLTTVYKSQKRAASAWNKKVALVNGLFTRNR